MIFKNMLRLISQHGMAWHLKVSRIRSSLAVQIHPKSSAKANRTRKRVRLLTISSPSNSWPSRRHFHKNELTGLVWFQPVYRSIITLNEPILRGRTIINENSFDVCSFAYLPKNRGQGGHQGGGEERSFEDKFFSLRNS